MRDRDRDKSGSSRTFKWLAGSLAVLTVLGMGFAWLSLRPAESVGARTASVQPSAHDKPATEKAEADLKATIAREEAGRKVAERTAAENAAAEKAASEEAHAKLAQKRVSARPVEAKEGSRTYKTESETATSSGGASGGGGGGNATASAASPTPNATSPPVSAPDPPAAIVRPAAEPSAQPLPRPPARETAEIVPREATAAPPAVAPNSIDAELAKLMTGNVAFNTPERTHVGEELSVQATLSTTLKAEELTVLVTEPGKVETAPLKVSRRMIATLAGGSAFDISPGGPVTQWVSESEPTTWTWIVTPKAVGEQFLILTFDAIITIDGKDDKRSLRTFKKRINVEVGWPHTLGEWIELLKKWGEGASYFWGLAIAIVGGAWAWLRRRGRAAKATGGQPSIGDNPTGW